MPTKRAMWTAVALMIGLSLVLSAGVASGQPPQARAAFAVGSASANPGHKATGAIAVPAGVDEATNIPVAIIHGARPGPVLAIIAGSHGTEYASIVALERLINLADPAQMSGTLVIIPLVNVPSFEGGVAHFNPVDGKNMNRVYPGLATGTQSERAAWAITREVVERCDHLIDIHGGDTDESLRPYTYWTVTGKEPQDTTSKQMALAFGLDTIIISADRPKDPAQSRYLENTATTRGKPSITAEAGHAGTVETDDVQAVTNGCMSVMRYLKMLPGEPSFIENPVWIQALANLTSETTGILYPLIKRGTYAEKGMRVGYVTDYVGTKLADVRAPEAGVVLYVRAIPSVRKGDTIVSIGVPKR